jgi:transcriptional regulator
VLRVGGAVYIPKVNEEKRVPVLHALMQAHPLASLVTMSSSGLFASHIPMVLEADGSEFGVLKGHISRANTQWRDLTPDVDALAIFAGPQHYISASWYPGKHEHGKEVPTWNYAVVHAYGRLRVIHEADWLLKHLEGLTDIHEASSAVPWKVSDAPEAFIQTLLNGIVGFELPVRRLEGKWKVSQNRNERDRSAVVEGLDALNTPESLAMKALVEKI